jgi:hypothetical protein
MRFTLIDNHLNAHELSDSTVVPKRKQSSMRNTCAQDKKRIVEAFFFMRSLFSIYESIIAELQVVKIVLSSSIESTINRIQVEYQVTKFNEVLPVIFLRIEFL